MAYIGTDGNLHLSEEDANSGDYTDFQTLRRTIALTRP